MVNKIEHIGIAVKNIDDANILFEKLLGIPSYKTETVETESVVTSFFQTGTNKIELLMATNPESPIAKFLEKKGEGIHHIAFDVEDIFNPWFKIEFAGLHSILSIHVVKSTDCVELAAIFINWFGIPPPAGWEIVTTAL